MPNQYSRLLKEIKPTETEDNMSEEFDVPMFQELGDSRRDNITIYASLNKGCRELWAP
jgi:hypothetical protein